MRFRPRLSKITGIAIRRHAPQQPTDPATQDGRAKATDARPLSVERTTAPANDFLRRGEFGAADGLARLLLFDTPRFVRNLEAGYATIWQRYLTGKSPDHVLIDEAP